ncbi:MAG: esterase/lipase family protein, partial [Acidimicrobiales bacterium]
MAGKALDCRHPVWEPLRAGFELARLVGAIPWLLLAPRGDGHPVLVLPGFLANDLSTAMLRWHLSERGYHVRGWGLGINDGPRDEVASALLELVRDAASGGRRVSLVGWSLGGVLAWEAAAAQPALVRQVITLGSPLHLASPRARRSPVPLAAIYSRTDAIVDWRHAVAPPGPRRESVEVRGSHLGLGHNVEVLLVVADRLAQRDG